MELKAKEIRKQQWKQIITNCNNSGISKKQWCLENGINEKSFYYYQKVLRDELIESSKEECNLPSFVDVTSQLQTTDTYEHTPVIPVLNNKPDLVIRKGDLSFEISNTISSSLLRTLGGMLNA